MKSNVNVKDPLPNPTSSVPPLAHQQSPSEMTTPTALADVKPITHPPGVVFDPTEKTLQAENLQDSQATSSTPVSSADLMEIIPPHQLQVTTPLESATLVSSSDSNFSTSELQSLTEIQHTPLTEGQIEDAKNLVLDLLGWGVDPEYLVTSGVHPELIYRIFTDLNLRLPTNLVLFDDG